MNNINKIKSLLDKYWEGESTISEEQTLRSYFNSGDVDSSLEQYQDLFQVFALEATISSKTSTEASMKALKSSGSAKIRPLRKWIFSVAASVALLVSAVWLYKQKEVVTPNAYVHEVEDAQEALEITKDALAFLSIKFDKSTKTINDNVQKIKAARKFK